MDIDKLIKRMKCPQIQSCPMDGEYPSCKACQKSIQQEVITALSTLQAENEKLRAEVEQVKQAAENDIPYNCHTCKHCSDPMCPGNTTKNSFGFQENCNSWQWRG